VVARRQLHRLVHLPEQALGDPPVPAAGEADAHAVLVQLVAPADEDRLVEAHEVAHLVRRPLPVLRRERVDREPLDTQVERALHRVEQRFFTGGVAVGSLEAPPLRPAPVAVHHTGDVGGNTGVVDAGDLHGPDVIQRVPVRRLLKASCTESPYGARR
jgi:hypothetical protein